MRRMAVRRIVVVVAAVALLLTGCTTQSPTVASSSRVIRVPGDAATIQAGVDQARSGDTVEVHAGTYEESVAITTKGVTLRGADRNAVVLDGGGLRGSGVVVTASGVAVENLTVRNYTLNGVLLTGLTEDGGLARGSDGYTRLDPKKYPPLRGFAVRYVTAANNGLYGIYAFDSQHGVIEQNYASGHADSGIYLGQCQNCDVVVRANVAEYNAVGYEQANASNPVAVVGNRFSDNRVGASLLSDYQEAFVPQKGTTFAGNLVADNAQQATPEEADGAFGLGAAVSGGQEDLLLRNRITGNPTAGIQIGSVEDVAPNGNRVEGNEFASNGVDLAYTASERAPGSGLCAVGNVLATTSPADLLATWDCASGGSPAAPGATIDRVRAPQGISFRDVPLPPTQPQIPERAEHSASPPPVDLESVTVPAVDLLADRVRS